MDRLSLIHRSVFRDHVGTCHCSGSMAFGLRATDSCDVAAELVSPGAVFGTKHSDLCGCYRAEYRLGGARVVGVRDLSPARAMAGEDRYEPRRAGDWAASNR